MIHRNSRGCRRSEGGSLATTAANGPWSVPRSTLVAEAVAHGGDRFRLVGAKELGREMSGGEKENKRAGHTSWQAHPGHVWGCFMEWRQ